MGHEFFEREDGFRGLTAAYDLKFENAPRGIELGLIYQALMEGEVDFVAGSATDGLIAKFELAVLEDDRSYFPPYDAAAVYRPSTAERVPALAAVLGLLEGSLDEARHARPQPPRSTTRAAPRPRSSLLSFWSGDGLGQDAK